MTDLRTKWGPCTVVRTSTYVTRKGKHVTLLGIHTDDHELEVQVSGRGRKVKVWCDGKRLRS